MFDAKKLVGVWAGSIATPLAGSVAVEIIFEGDGDYKIMGSYGSIGLEEGTYSVSSDGANIAFSPSQISKQWEEYGFVGGGRSAGVYDVGTDLAPQITISGLGFTKKG
jgi:hypothetical protein